MEQSNNMDLWNKVCTTDPKNTREGKSSGRTYTAIQPQTQIKKATSIWGSYGDKWGLRDKIESDPIPLHEGNVLIKLTATFYYPKGSFQESTSGYLVRYVNKPNGKSYLSTDIDVFKKLSTDLLTKCLSKLGFNSDVFEGRFDDQGYMDSLGRYNDYELESMLVDSQLLADKLKGINTIKALVKLYNSNPRYATDEECSTMFSVKRKEIENG